METPKQKEQYLFIDILRIIACFFVIVNHSVDKVIYLRDPSDIMWWVSMAWFFLSKFAVPIFLMITGYNLLDRVDSPKKSLIRVCRIAAVLILVSGFYYIFQWLLYERGEISARQFLIAFLKGHVSNALWYLYLYLGILIMLPFLQKLASVLTKQNILFLLAVSGIVFGLYPIVVHYYPFMAYTECFELPLFGTYIGMLFIGLYMKKYAKRSTLLLSLSVIGVILPVVCNVILTKGEYAVYGPRLEMLFFDNRELFPIVLQSASLFYLVMYFTPPEKMQRRCRRSADAHLGYTFSEICCCC